MAEEWVFRMPNHVELGRCVALLLSCDEHGGAHWFTVKGDENTITVSDTGMNCLKKGFEYDD